MSGKCRPCLRRKTLCNVWFSELSNTDKDCITAVFDRFEEQQAEIERLESLNETNNMAIKGLSKEFDNLKAEAVKEFADRLKKRMGFCDLPNGIVKSHIDNLLKETEGEMDG